MLNFAILNFIRIVFFASFILYNHLVVLLRTVGLIFDFLLLLASFYPTSPRKKNKKTTSAADVSLNNSE